MGDVCLLGGGGGQKEGAGENDKGRKREEAINPSERKGQNQKNNTQQKLKMTKV